MKVHCKSMVRPDRSYVAVVVCLNFDQALIAIADEDTDDTDSWIWYRCENCEIALENPEKEER